MTQEPKTQDTEQLEGQSSSRQKIHRREGSACWQMWSVSYLRHLDTFFFPSRGFSQNFSLFSSVAVCQLHRLPPSPWCSFIQTSRFTLISNMFENKSTCSWIMQTFVILLLSPVSAHLVNVCVVFTPTLRSAEANLWPCGRSTYGPQPFWSRVCLLFGAGQVMHMELVAFRAHWKQRPPADL